MDPRHRSRIVTDGIARAPARAMLRAVGFDDEDFARPQIGVVAAANDLTPCNAALDPLAAAAAHGVRTAGGVPMRFSTIAISDGIGLCIGHVAPEAATGGPLALVVDGDPIIIDIPARTLELGVDAAELEQRRHRWDPPPPLPGNGFLAKYIRLVGCASQGALVGATPP